MTELDVIEGHIDDKTASLKDWLAAGHATSYEDYKRICGEITGLLSVKRDIQDLKHKLENSDE